jgi:hypothetical protein
MDWPALCPTLIFGVLPIVDRSLFALRKRGFWIPFVFFIVSFLYFLTAFYSPSKSYYLEKWSKFF